MVGLRSRQAHLFCRPSTGQQHPGHAGKHPGLDARPDARLLRATLRCAQYHRCSGRQFRLAAAGRPADSSYHDYQGTGSFYTSFSCEPGQAHENLGIVLEVLRDVQRDGIREEELHQAKSKILSRVVRGSERPMGRMQAIGMAWIYLNEYRAVDDDLRAFDAVTLQTIRDVLDQYPLDRFTTLALGPLDRTALAEGNGKK